MSIGGKWKLSGGLYVPNPRFVHDTDFFYSATGTPLQLPDGWTRYVPGVRELLVQMVDGYSDGRAVMCQPAEPGITEPNWLKFIAARSPSLSVPYTESPTPKMPPFSVSVMYKMGADFFNPGLDPTLRVYAQITFYDLDESNSFTWTSSNYIDANVSTWTRFDFIFANLSIPFNIEPDHAIVNFGFGASGTTEEAQKKVWIDDVVARYNLLNEIVAPQTFAKTYTEMESKAHVTGYRPVMKLPGRFQDTDLGQTRYVDTTGGSIKARMTVTFPALTNADKALLSECILLNGGGHCAARGDARDYQSFLLHPQPIVVEPDPGDVATYGKFPPYFYAWILDMTDPEPSGPSTWTSTLTLGEVG